MRIVTSSCPPVTMRLAQTIGAENEDDWRSEPDVVVRCHAAANEYLRPCGPGSQEISPVSGALIEQRRCADGHHSGLNQPPLKSSDSCHAWEFSPQNLTEVICHQRSVAAQALPPKDSASPKITASRSCAAQSYRDATWQAPALVAQSFATCRRGKQGSTINALVPRKFENAEDAPHLDDGLAG